jgi:hypothetical protein
MGQMLWVLIILGLTGGTMLLERVVSRWDVKKNSVQIDWEGLLETPPVYGRIIVPPLPAFEVAERTILYTREDAARDMALKRAGVSV